MDAMRRFHQILEATGQNPPPFEAWSARFPAGRRDLWPLCKAGQMIGGVLFLDNVAHIAVLPEWQGRWLTKGLLRAYRTWTHAVPIVAAPLRTNRPARLLARRLGFKRITRQGEFIVYHKEPVPCLQH